ncbi:hypothetical protein CORC01_12368, partial [Colletotrichum orchidophilum]
NSQVANTSSRNRDPIYYHHPSEPFWQDSSKGKGALSFGGTKDNNWGCAPGGSSGGSGGGSSGGGGGTKK